jgi:NAD(P)-dependent dehydrogenase (short-subunit alcohol dehydrogenase family)
MSKTAFVTGARRPLGGETVRTAVRGRDQVIAAARNRTTITAVSVRVPAEGAWIDPVALAAVATPLTA